MNYENRNKKIIPEKVVELAYNDNYILVKQFKLKEKYPGDIKRTVKIPDESEAYYWIIDIKNEEIYSKYTEEEFENKKEELNIKELELKPTIKYLKE